MKLTNIRHKGFSAVEIIIVLAVLVVGGALGYVFVSRQQAAEPQAESVVTTPATTTESARAEAANVGAELEGLDIDQTLDTGVIDEALE